MNRPPQMGPLRVPGGPLSMTQFSSRADATNAISCKLIETAIHHAVLRGGPGFIDHDDTITKDEAETVPSF